MGFISIYWTMSGSIFCRVLFWENVDICGKTAVFPGGYGGIREIMHGRIRLDWGL